MIKEALEFITGLKEGTIEPIIKEINGKVYCNQKLIRYDEIHYAKPIDATTLTAMINYIRYRKEELHKSMILHIEKPTEVSLYSGLNGERDREYLFGSCAIVNSFHFGRWYNQEEFLIGLQANFQASDDLALIQKVAGNIESKTTANYVDDGISQKTTIKQGVANKTDVIVPNPVTLIPYRTFNEVEQPHSQFVFRIKDDGGEPTFALIEAEGGLWKNQAMENIRKYFLTYLSDFDKKQITIIA